MCAAAKTSTRPREHRSRRPGTKTPESTGCVQKLHVNQSHCSRHTKKLEPGMILCFSSRYFQFSTNLHVDAGNILGWYTEEAEVLFYGHSNPSNGNHRVELWTDWSYDDQTDTWSFADVIDLVRTYALEFCFGEHAQHLCYGVCFKPFLLHQHWFRP